MTYMLCQYCRSILTPVGHRQDCACRRSGGWKSPKGPLEVWGAMHVFQVEDGDLLRALRHSLKDGAGSLTGTVTELVPGVKQVAYPIPF